MSYMLEFSSCNSHSHKKKKHMKHKRHQTDRRSEKYRRSEVSRSLVLFGNKIYTYVEPGTIFTQMYILFRNAQDFQMNILFPNGVVLLKPQFLLETRQ
jgi:hypothetical protein